MKAIYDELAEAGAIEITDDDLDQVAGGFLPCGPDKYYEWLKKHQSDFV